MTPNKKIPGFCFESPWLKPFDLIMESVVVQVATRRIRTTWTPELEQHVLFGTQAELGDVMTRHLTHNLFYFDYNYGPIEEPVVYDDGSWSMGNTFDGVIGIKSEIKPHTLI